MNDFSPRFEPSSDRLSRARRIATRFPAAGNLANLIANRSKPFKFGIDKDALSQNYRFIPLEHATEFFKSEYLKFHQEPIDEDMLEDRITASLNIDVNKRGIGERFDKRSTIKLISSSVNELIEKINEQATNVPYVKFVIGPTGSGKTSFSKALFTFGHEVFWRASIIPTRVEFSKFFRHDQPLREGELLNAIEKCKFRDALIWLLFSGPADGRMGEILQQVEVDDFNYRKLLTDLSIDLSSQRLPHGYFTLEYANEKIFDVYRKISPAFARAFIQQFSIKYKMRFLVSLDGFDIVHPIDFLITKDVETPADKVAFFIKDILTKFSADHTVAGSQSHFLIYVRDTTYRKLESVLSIEPGGRTQIDPCYIVPPPYEMMIDKVTRLVSTDISSNDAELHVHVGAFNAGMKLSFDAHVFKHINSDIDTFSIASFFGWNARNMKRHVRKMLHFYLWRMVDEEASVLVKGEVSGNSEAELWDAIMKKSGHQQSKGYQFIEELFLDDTHQLTPQIARDVELVEKLLDKGELLTAVRSVSDLQETNGFYDCVLHYLTREAIVATDQSTFPGLLLIVRIIQLCQGSNEVRFSHIDKRLRKLGYKVSENRLQFVIYVLLKNELIFIKEYGRARSLKDCEFGASWCAVFLLGRVLPSVTYLGECITLANLPDDQLRSEIKRKGSGSDLFEWLEAMIINSIIAFNYIQKCEGLEKECACSSDESFDNIWIAKSLRSALYSEIERILGSGWAQMRRREAEVRLHISSLSGRLDDFDPVI